MGTGDHYRIRAAEFHARACNETNRTLKTQFDNLALAYLRLAELADRNDNVELVYEPPPPKLDNPRNQT
jgi:hypothetical protein